MHQLLEGNFPERGHFQRRHRCQNYFADLLNIDLLCFRNKCFTFRVDHILEGACCAKKQT